MLNLHQLSDLELRQICYFLTIVEQGNSFSRAAESLHIEQPPLSQRIKSLEKRLKITLFDRSCRPVQLTPAGLVFWQESRVALTHLQQAITQSQRAAQGDIGHLSLGVASSVVNGILPEILRQFRSRYPSVVIDLHELTAEQQLQALRDRRLDLGMEVFSIAEVGQLDSPLQRQVIAQESLVIALPEGHPLTMQSSIPLAAIVQEPLILPSLSAFPFYHSFLERCTQEGLQPQLVQTTTATWMLTLLGMVVAGMGIAVLPSNVLTIQRQGVVYRDIDGLTLKRDISAVWHQQHNSIVLTNFLQLLPSIPTL